ncbi:lytic polysaccharide monooxygenase [Streptomyces sp. NPDC005551]|uniref:lytic polysaccharide monooxygenase n=1 Tax=Streptomyces sp. NPDC005551 TaxID=3364725 RepID=UPI00367389BF
MTKPGYDPAKPLTWSDLPTRPFATATDPSLVKGAYRIAAKLPADRSGRHVLFTVWQDSSTADTYYSCSDVVFARTGGGGTAAAAQAPDSGGASGPAKPSRPASSKTPEPSEPASASAAAPAEAATPAEDVAADRSEPVADSSSRGPAALPLLAGGAGALLLTTGGALALRRRRGRVG